MIKIAFFDIDGTLLAPGNQVCDTKTIIALSRLKELGIKIIVATGRPPVRLPNLPIEFDGYIHFNGQYCIIEDIVLREVPLNKEDVLTVISNAEKMRKGIGLASVDFFGCNIFDHQLSLYLKNSRTDYPILENFEDAISKDIYQIVAPISEDEESLLLRNTKTLKAVRWNNLAADIIPVNGGKEIAVQSILDYTGIDSNEAMAFGDGENDIPMLKLVNYGVAMGNASNKVKKAAKYITESVYNSGIYEALRSFHLI